MFKRLWIEYQSFGQFITNTHTHTWRPSPTPTLPIRTQASVRILQVMWRFVPGVNCVSETGTWDHYRAWEISAGFEVSWVVRFWWDSDNNTLLDVFLGREVTECGIQMVIIYNVPGKSSVRSPCHCAVEYLRAVQNVIVVPQGEGVVRYKSFIAFIICNITLSSQ